MKRIVVVGSGPAGLAAAERLLTESEEPLDLTLATMGHILGGKACSWKTEDGRTLEHGQHVMLGFYEQMRALLRRAGIDPLATSVSGRGRFTIFEDRDQRSHELHLAHSSLVALVDGLRYTGLNLREKAGLASLMAREAPRIILGVPEAWDDLCLTAWCLERGLPLSFVQTNAFRMSREAQLNYPGEISAYTMLKTIRVAGRDYQSAEARIPAGGMSSIWWDRIADRIEGLGGEIARYQQLTGLVHDGRRLTGLDFATPAWHGPTLGHDHAPVPTVPGTERREAGFDAAILTLPPGSLRRVIGADATLLGLPGMGGIPKLTDVAPLGMHVWHKAAVARRRVTIVGGLPAPLGFVIDNKPIYPDYQQDSRFGACLHFVGQEAGFEDWEDEALLARSMAALRRVDGFEAMDLDGVIDFAVVRNRAPHKRYWNAEPGSLRHKPTPRTALSGLYLAGDWVRSELDFPCMENAIRSGREAAGLVLRDLRARRAA